MSDVDENTHAKTSEEVTGERGKGFPFRWLAGRHVRPRHSRAALPSRTRCYWSVTPPPVAVSPLTSIASPRGFSPRPTPPKVPAKKRRKRKIAPIAVNLSNCKYELLRIVQKKLGWKEVGDDDEWQLYWTDTSVSIERIMRLKSTQKINHFTGMLEICRKKQLAKNLSRMSAKFPDDFKFAPKTFVLPIELNDFLDQFKGKKRKTFILKPDAGCQGKGIALAQSADQAMKALNSISGEDGYKTAPVVAQRYLTKPFLIDGFKFDLRIYALVLCADPLRIFVFNDGLARFCTEKYEPPKANNLKDVCMHLTNYAVNKHNENFVFNEDAGASDEGSKWSIQGLKEWMETNGHDFSAMWAGCVDLIVKTVISIQPVLAHNYHSVLPPEDDGYRCFEILGLDVMMDAELRPWLIEVNHSPSFTVDTPLDLSIKEDLISDTIELVRIDPKAIKRAQAEEKAEAQSRLTGGGGVKSSGGGRLTREEIEARRAAALEARMKWEENHSGSFDIAYPSPDPTKQALYERLLEGAKEAFDQHGSHSRVRDTLERAKAQAQRKASEEEAKAAAARHGLKAPSGAKLRRAVDAAMAGKKEGQGGVDRRTGSEGGAAPGPGVCDSRGRLGRRRGSSEQLGEQSSADDGMFRLYYPSELLGLSGPWAGRNGKGGGSSEWGPTRDIMAHTAASVARSAANAAAAAAAAAAQASGAGPLVGSPRYGRRATSSPTTGFVTATTSGAVAPTYASVQAMMTRMGMADDVGGHVVPVSARRSNPTLPSSGHSGTYYAGLAAGAFAGGGTVAPFHANGFSASRPGSGRQAGQAPAARRLTTREVKPTPSHVASMAAAHAAQHAGLGGGATEHHQAGYGGGDQLRGGRLSAGGYTAGGHGNGSKHADLAGGTKLTAAAGAGVKNGTGFGGGDALTCGPFGGASQSQSTSFCRSMSLSARRRGDLSITGTGTGYPGSARGNSGGGR